MRKIDVLCGFIATDLGETESDEDLHITISGHQENGRPMYQNITVIYFDTKEKSRWFSVPASLSFRAGLYCGHPQSAVQ